MLALKRGKNTPLSCHQCPIQKEHLSMCNVAMRRIFLQVKPRLLSVLPESKTILDTFVDMFMLPFHVLAAFSFVAVHPELEIYAIFGVAPIHELSFRISRPQQQCLFNHLSVVTEGRHPFVLFPKPGSLLALFGDRCWERSTFFERNGVELFGIWLKN